MHQSKLYLWYFNYFTSNILYAQNNTIKAIYIDMLQLKINTIKKEADVIKEALEISDSPLILQIKENQFVLTDSGFVNDRFFNIDNPNSSNCGILQQMQEELNNNKKI